ncbi:hypothetical protein B9Z65_3793 [Elsinoe australis]|uniref:Ubiquitin-like protease family profile domain-containing protein n=1 Tax=Elsinoe australis TaxID=40998 RepID=A0A2P8AG74_9PEZI|nr:hypothetical protein B9Z65_3793 [Elsinoe australis]
MPSWWGSARLVATALSTSFAGLSRATSVGRRAIQIRFTAIRNHIKHQLPRCRAVSASQNVPTGSKRSRDAFDDETERPVKRRTPSPAPSDPSALSFDTVSTTHYNETWDGFGRYDDTPRYQLPPLRKKAPARDAEEKRYRQERRQKKILKRRAAMTVRKNRITTSFESRAAMKDILQILVDREGLDPAIIDDVDRDNADEVEDLLLGEERELKKIGKLELRRKIQEKTQEKRTIEMIEEERFRQEKAKKKKRLAQMRRKQEREARGKQFEQEREEYDRYLAAIGQLDQFSIAEEGPDGAKRFDKYGRLLPPTKKVEKRKYITPLSTEWQDKVKQALAVRSETVVLGKSIEGVELSRKDIGRILPGEPWLNDEIVNAFYANLCARQNELDGYVKGPNNVPGYAAYSTAWYKNATERGITSINTWSRRKGIKGDKLLRTERIFFPTNTGAHWTLLTISGKNKTIEYFDSMNERGFTSKKNINLAMAWLKMELGAKFKEDEWTVLQSKSAQQNNMNDCGVFACLNGWALVKGSLDPSAEFQASDIPMARHMLAAALMNGGFTGDFDLHV